MSWRVLILLLLFAMVASWQGGQQLGHWLVDQAPESIASAFNSKEDRRQVLDADGKPLAPQPPQPRIDGTLGVPREMSPVEWTIAPIFASGADANSYKKDGDEDEENSEKSEDNRSADNTNTDSIRTIDVSPSAFTDSRRTPAATPASPDTWQQALKKELTRCSGLGFFQRPNCITTAQNKFCGPNNAWGKTADCPAQTNNISAGG